MNNNQLKMLLKVISAILAGIIGIIGGQEAVDAQ